MKKSQTYLIALLIIVLLLSACGGSDDANNNTNITNNTENSNNADSVNNVNAPDDESADQGTRFSVDDIVFDLGSEEANECANNLPLDFINEDAINDSGLDGEEVAQIIQDTFPIDQTYCAVEVDQETLDMLDEFDRLIDEGQTEEALQLIEDYSNKLDAELESDLELIPMASNAHLAAPALSHDGGAVYVYIRKQLAIAARLQLKDLWEEADYHIWLAEVAFGKYGFEELELLTDDFPAVLTALSISATAQTFPGLQDLNFAAQETAREILEKILPPTFEAFDPCIATRADVEYLDLLFVYGQVLDVQYAFDYTQDFYFDKLKKWQDIQRKRANGEEVPECPNTWSFEMDMTLQEDSATIVFHWEGFFQVFEAEGNLFIEGRLSATLDGGIPELDCLYFEGNQPIEDFNPTTYTGAARIPLMGEVEGEGDNAKFLLNTPEDFDEMKRISTLKATYANKNCGGVVEYDFMGQFFRLLMASPFPFMAEPTGPGFIYLELPAKAKTTTISVPLGEITTVYTIVIKDQSDN